MKNEKTEKNLRNENGMAATQKQRGDWEKENVQGWCVHSFGTERCSPHGGEKDSREKGIDKTKKKIEIAPLTQDWDQWGEKRKTT